MTASSDLPILCIGSVLWDTIGRTDMPMKLGYDVPGRVIRLPGGVAMNIAMALRQVDQPVMMLSALGRDAAGDELMAAARERGIKCRHIYRSDNHSTDQYMAIEAQGHLIAATADAHALEALAGHVVAPLSDGRLGSAEAPYPGMIVAETNLPEAQLRWLAQSPALALADLRIAPASPGKALRLLPFLQAGRGTPYVNLIEARLILDQDLPDAAQAALALCAAGAVRAVVTDGPNLAAVADGSGAITAIPPSVDVTRVTGAGDVFMASHIAAERAGLVGLEALRQAQARTARYISGQGEL